MNPLFKEPGSNGGQEVEARCLLTYVNLSHSLSPGSVVLKLRNLDDGPLSNIAFHFDLRRYGKDPEPQRQIETTSFC